VTAPLVTAIADRTQNITAAGANATQLTGTATLIPFTYTSDWVASGVWGSNQSLSVSGTMGAQFDVVSTLSISKIYIPASHFTDAVNRPFRFWKYNTLSATYDTFGDLYTVPKTTLQGSYYVLQLASTLQLSPARYRYGVLVPANAPYNGNGVGPSTFTYDTRITNVVGTFVQSSLITLPVPTYTNPLTGGFFIQDAIAGTITADKFTRSGGGSPNEFLKSNGTYDATAYITATDSSIVTLQQKTANISRTDTTTSITGTIALSGPSDEFLMANGSTNVNVYLNSTNGTTLSSPLATPTTLFPSSGTQPAPFSAFAVGKTLLWEFRGPFTCQDSKVQETVTIGIYNNAALIWNPPAITLTPPTVTNGSFQLVFELVRQETTKYSAFLTFYVSNGETNTVTATYYTGLSNVTIPATFDVRVALAGGTGDITMTTILARVRQFR